MRRVSYLALLVLCVAGDASAHHRHRRAVARVPRSYFLAANPHIPLAIVRGSTVSQAVPIASRGHKCGPRSRWRVAGSRWHELDTWGQIVGTYSADSFDDYDVTGCAEITFDRAPKDDTAHVFVSADSPWRPSASTRYVPPAQERAAFGTLLADVVRGFPQQNLTRECTEIADEMLFFSVGADRFAVGGRAGGYVVSSLDHGVWKRELVERDTPQPGTTPSCYRPVAVFDMNGDGVPEIVMRRAEPGEWNDSVLERDPTGAWREVAVSFGGSTA